MNTPLARYMHEADIDDAGFASLIGKDRSMVNRIRRGVIRPTLEVAAEIEVKTKGKVSMQSWFEPLARKSKRRTRASAEA